MKSLSRRDTALLLVPALFVVTMGFYFRQREWALANQPSELEVTDIYWDWPPKGPVRGINIWTKWKGDEPTWWKKPDVTPLIKSMVLIDCNSKKPSRKLKFVTGVGGFINGQEVYRAEYLFSVGKNETWSSCVEARLAFVENPRRILQVNPQTAGETLYEVPIRFQFKDTGKIEILK